MCYCMIVECEWLILVCMWVIPCMWRLAVIPRYFGDRISWSNTPHLSINWPLLGNYHWFTWMRDLLYLYKDCNREIEVSIWQIWKLKSCQSSELTYNVDSEWLIDGRICVIGWESVDPALWFMNSNQPQFTGVPATFRQMTLSVC